MVELLVFQANLVHILPNQKLELDQKLKVRKEYFLQSKH